MGKWLDLRRNFGVQHFAYSTGRPPANTATHVAQAVCRGFLARARMIRRQARAQALGQPGQAMPQQVHADTATARQAADAAVRKLCTHCSATPDRPRRCDRCPGPGLEMHEARQLAHRLVSAATVAEQHSRNLRHAEARVEMKATAN